MFGNADVIAASRKFVCVRIDTYESEANEKLVRDLMDGVFVNTTFCLFAPDGKMQLSSTSRSFTNQIANAAGLDRVSRKYEATRDATEALTPDFHSFRSALNVAAADGRLLVLIAAPNDKTVDVEKRLRPVAWHADVVGRFHFDFETQREKYAKKIGLAEADGSGIYIIQPGEFGLQGEVLHHLPLNADEDAIRDVMLRANSQFAKSARPKTYESHVAEGRRQGIYFEMAVRYGEDRDADGKIDARHAERFQRARRRAEQTGKLIPVD